MKPLIIAAIAGLAALGAGGVAWAASSFKKTLPGQVKGTNTVKGMSGKNWLQVADGLAQDGNQLFDVYVGPGVYTGIDSFAPVLQFKQMPSSTPGQHGPRLLTQRYPASATQAYPDALSDFQVQAA